MVLFINIVCSFSSSSSPLHVPFFSPPFSYPSPTAISCFSPVCFLCSCITNLIPPLWSLHPSLCRHQAFTFSPSKSSSHCNSQALNICFHLLNLNCCIFPPYKMFQLTPSDSLFARIPFLSLPVIHHEGKLTASRPTSYSFTLPTTYTPSQTPCHVVKSCRRWGQLQLEICAPFQNQSHADTSLKVLAHSSLVTYRNSETIR